MKIYIICNYITKERINAIFFSENAVSCINISLKDTAPPAIVTLREKNGSAGGRKAARILSEI